MVNLCIYFINIGQKFGIKMPKLSSARVIWNCSVRFNMLGREEKFKMITQSISKKTIRVYTHGQLNNKRLISLYKMYISP